MHWGEWLDDAFVYCGKMVTADRKNKKIIINMAGFIKGIEVRMPSSRGPLEEKLTPAEMTEF